MNKEMVIPQPPQNPMRDLLKRLDAQDATIQEVLALNRDVVQLLQSMVSTQEAQSQLLQQIANHVVKLK